MSTLLQSCSCAVSFTKSIFNFPFEENKQDSLCAGKRNQGKLIFVPQSELCILFTPPPQYFGVSHSEPQLPTHKMWASQGWWVCWAGQSELFFVAFSSLPSSLGAFLGFSTTP